MSMREATSSSPPSSKQESSSLASSRKTTDTFGSAEFSTAVSFTSRSKHTIVTESLSCIKLSHKETSKNANVEALTINKLRFSKVGLTGRDKERAILAECLDKVVAAGEAASPSQSNASRISLAESQDDTVPTRSSGYIKTIKTREAARADRQIEVARSGRQMVFISGDPGTGKTALANTLADQTKIYGGVYLTGKFDLCLHDEPYSGIISACQELCGEIFALRVGDSEKYQRVRNAIITELGDEIALISNMIPVMNEIIDIDTDPRNALKSSPANQSTGNKEARNRFNFAFRKFIRVISAYFKPLVLVIDDLQWADTPSLELLETMISDNSNTQLMIIGCYRSNEVDSAHYLSKKIRDLHERKNAGFQITEIHIGNLDVDAVNQIIMTLLSEDSADKTSLLAETCHKRTLGNAFHLVSFLSMLNEKDLLTFSLGLLRWNWDESKIEEETAAAENVVDMVREKMHKQSNAMCKILQLASCLGSSFEAELLVRVWETLGKSSERGSGPSDIYSKEGVELLLSIAIEESFIEVHGKEYRWIHDKVQEAAMGLVEEPKIASFKLQVGEILLAQLSDQELENSLFVVVSLLNSTEESSSSGVKNTDKRAIFAELNLRAAKKAVAFSAFESVAKYAEVGISFLSPEKWTRQQETSKELYSLCTEAHYILGNTEKMAIYSEEILEQKHLTTLDKLQVYASIINAKGAGGRASEALHLSLDVLDQLGCKFPRSVARQTFKAVASLGTTKLPSDELIVDLPLLTDEKKKACMMLMINASTYAHYCSNLFGMIMILSRMVRWTIKYGIDVNSPAAFALFGFVKLLGGDLQVGNAYAEQALVMLEKLDSKKVESRVTYLVWFMLAPWTKPLQSTLKHLLQGYKVGMEVGDTESALWNISMYICSSISAGRSLWSLHVDCRTYFAQMEELRQDDILTNSLPFWQGIMNLIYGNEDPLLLNGEAMEEEAFTIKVQSEQTPRNFLHMQIFKNQMANYFGEYEMGAKLALARGDSYFKKCGAPLVMSDFFHQSISLFAMARITKTRMYVKKARKIAAILATWAKKGNPNVHHYVVFLNAEEAALKGETDEASHLYAMAINSAARTGFQQDAALASERFGDYLLNDLHDTERAVLRLKDAIKFYSNWGATYKAKKLQEQCASLWVSPSQLQIDADADDVSQLGDYDTSRDFTLN